MMDIKVLRHYKELLNLFTIHLPDMLWIKDIDGKFIYANQAICDGLLIAKDPSEVIGKTDIYFAQIQRDQHKENKEWHTFGELCYNSDKIVIQENKPMRFEEYGNVKGKLLYLEVYKAPFYDESGNIIGTVGAGRDITELKNIQLNQEKMMLHQSRQAAMGEMIESIAHQWRQPLNIMGLAIANIETQIAMRDVDKEELSQKLEAIVSNINYLSNTIDDFRNFLNPAADEHEIIFSPISSVEETLRILEAQFKDSNIQIKRKFDESNFAFKGVENEFKQVLFILLNNSIDAIKKSLSESCIKEGLITFLLKKEKNIGVLKVIDNGGGIEESIQSKIYEPYFTTKHKSSGTGIGLYIAKNIIETRMKGSLEYSSINKGSCFCIELPIHKI